MVCCQFQFIIFGGGKSTRVTQHEYLHFIHWIHWKLKTLLKNNERKEEEERRGEERKEEKEGEGEGRRRKEKEGEGKEVKEGKEEKENTTKKVQYPEDVGRSSIGAGCLVWRSRWISVVIDAGWRLGFGRSWRREVGCLVDICFPLLFGPLCGWLWSKCLFWVSVRC